MKVVYVAIALLFIGAAVFGLISFFPSQQIKEKLPLRVVEEGNYIAYFPVSRSEITHLVVITPPGTGKEEAKKYFSLWRDQADAHAFGLLNFPLLESDVEVGSALRNLPDDLKNMKIIMTGLSAGGYFSCGTGLRNDDIVDAIIPMASFCDASIFQKNPPQTIPILTVIGSKDAWALGDDGTLPYKSRGDLREEFLIIEGLGHAFPRQAMDQVGEWIIEL